MLNPADRHEKIGAELHCINCSICRAVLSSMDLHPTYICPEYAIRILAKRLLDITTSSKMGNMRFRREEYQILSSRELPYVGHDFFTDADDYSDKTPPGDGYKIITGKGTIRADKHKKNVGRLHLSIKAFLMLIYENEKSSMGQVNIHLDNLPTWAEKVLDCLSFTTKTPSENFTMEETAKYQLGMKIHHTITVGGYILVRYIIQQIFQFF